MVSSKGGKAGFVYRSRHDVYRKLRKKGFTKEAAARVANAGKDKAGRSKMAKRAAATRKRRGR